MEITRERFVELWHNAGLDDVDLLAKGNLYETENFIVFDDSSSQQISFIYKNSLDSFYDYPLVFGWYKSLHVGRSLQCSVPTEEELIKLLNLLKEELDEDEKV